MYRGRHLLSLLLLAATPAAAQDVIRPGQHVTGRLSASDPRLEDGSHYDVWRFAGAANHRYRITMRSDDFDAYLAVGSAAASECGDCTEDDDGAGGTDAQVEFHRNSAGTWEIRANSFDESEMGEYELTLEDEGLVKEEHPHGGSAAMGTPVVLDQPVTGELRPGDRKQGNSFSDTWTYQGRAGERIVVTLRSQDFDAYLTMGAYEAGECTLMDVDDDGGGGTDSRLSVELAEDGAVHFHVMSVGAGATGAYTLLVERGQPRPAADLPMPIAPGETLNGRLSDTDAQEPNSSFRDTWTFRGRAGEAYVVTLRSAEFDALLHVGRTTDGKWVPLRTDDDSGGGTDSRVFITLPADGEYVIRAQSLEPGRTGPYTLTLERG